MTVIPASPSDSHPGSSSPAVTPSGTGLLVAFALAVLAGIVPIALIGSAGWWMLPVAVATLLILAAGLIALLARILDDDQ